MPITDRVQLSDKPCQLSAYSLRMHGRRINLRKEGGQISGRSIEAHPPEFDFARFLDPETISKAIYHPLGCK